MLPLVQLDSKGLYTYPNPLSQVPPGAMTIAQNVVCDQPGIVATRRGFDFYGDSLPSGAVKAFTYMTRLLFYCSAGELVYDSDGSGTWVTYSGTYSPPTGGFINSTQANGNFYFTTNNGVYTLDALAGTPVQAGVPEALDVSLAVPGVGTAVPTNAQVAYSLVWGYIDANDNLKLGAPSQWTYYVNTSGSTNDITITTTIPDGITTSHFLQIYRTQATSSSSIVPGNTFQLAAQYTPTALDISNKYVSVVDSTPDALLGAYEYTADGQPSSLPNSTPPLCYEVATYNSMNFYINFTTQQQATFTLASVGGTNGIANGDTFTITDQGGALTRTYTGAASNNFAIQEFEVASAGTIAEKIDTTARNLVACINQDPGNTLWYAYYQTGTNILPGGVILKARNLQSGAFFLNSSRTTCWTPVIPTSGQDYISSNTSSPDSFMVSKVAQPEAVPVAYTIPVQSGNISIQLFRALALQDALYLFSNGGVFRVTGSDPTNLQVILFDSSALLVGLQTPVILNNSIYYYATQGICNVSSGGNQIISRNIERDVIQLSALSNFSSLAFGCSYESDRKFFLFSPSNSGNLESTQQYVYNWITTAFTLWTRTASAAIVNQSTNKMYMADTDGNVFEERKSYSNLDYADQETAITINSIDTGNSQFTLADSTNVEIGDIIQQDVAGEQFSTQVLGNNTTTGIVDVASTDGFTTGSAQDFRSIAQLLQYTPLTCGFPMNMKKFANWKFAFSNANFESLEVSFTSDLYSIPESVDLEPINTGGWGAEPGGWGSSPWGVTSSVDQLIACNPGLNTSYARWMIVKMQLTEAFTSLSFDGITCSFDVVSTRGR
jgi:hypothetical protein